MARPSPFAHALGGANFSLTRAPPIDPGYTQEPRGWYANLIYGSSFDKGTTKVFAWNDVTTAGVGSAALDSATTGFNPNLPTPALKVVYTGGTGQAGWSNRGIGNEGMSLLGGAAYEGFAWVLAPNGGALYSALNNHVTGTLLAAKSTPLNASASWQRVDFVLTPTADATCVQVELSVTAALCPCRGLYSACSV